MVSGGRGGAPLGGEQVDENLVLAQGAGPVALRRVAAHPSPVGDLQERVVLDQPGERLAGVREPALARQQAAQREHHLFVLPAKPLAGHVGPAADRQVGQEVAGVVPGGFLQRRDSLRNRPRIRARSTADRNTVTSYQSPGAPSRW